MWIVKLILVCSIAAIFWIVAFTGAVVIPEWVLFKLKKRQVQEAYDLSRIVEATL